MLGAALVETFTRRTAAVIPQSSSCVAATVMDVIPTRKTTRFILYFRRRFCQTGHLWCSIRITPVANGLSPRKTLYYSSSLWRLEEYWNWYNNWPIKHADIAFFHYCIFVYYKTVYSIRITWIKEANHVFGILKIYLVFYQSDPEMDCYCEILSAQLWHPIPNHDTNLNPKPLLALQTLGKRLSLDFALGIAKRNV